MKLFVKRVVARAIPLRAIATHAIPVLTYHACHRDAPEEIVPIDNISPAWLYDQISALKKAVRFVPVDELATCRPRKGVAAVTFDDGYRSVIQEALPVLIALDVPFTIFVNTYALSGKVFWRHKVTYIVNNGLTKECEAFMQGVHSIPGQSFYNYLKDPRNNSRLVDHELDRFLAYKGTQLSIPQHMCSQRSDFISHPLVWYGNHTHNHYVLASLSRAEQRLEIETTKSYLEQLPGIQVSRCLALPFGRADQANDDTLLAMQDADYHVLLLNRGGTNVRGLAAGYGPQMLERFSVNESPIAWEIAKHFGMTVQKIMFRGSMRHL